MTISTSSARWAPVGALMAFAFLATNLTVSPLFAVDPPAAYGPVPSARQLAWQDDELYAFAHFGVNTFTNKEWGDGDESESVFNPTDFNADQIVTAIKDGGFKGLILTAKHHDGFCLWPSQFTKHSVKNSPWKQGKGDVVAEVSAACRKQGIKFGIYLSPWDRNHAEYGRPGYLVTYQNQLKELLSNYGPIFEVWLDGANGGSGYYGGAREERKIETTSYYQWPNVWVGIMRKLQPGCNIHSDFGPDNRWGGSESGEEGVPCWSTLHNKDLTFASVWGSPRNSNGERPGELWVPAEADTSIRPGWFYHASEDGAVKGATQLMNIYYTSVGRGADLLLNIPPDTRGRIADVDVKALREFASLRQRTFAVNLAAKGTFSPSNVRGGAMRFGAENLVDGKLDTYWCSDDGVTTPEVTIEFPAPVTFNVVNLQECIPLGQRIDAFEIDQWQNDAWQKFANGTSIGHRALIKTGPITTKRVRLRVTAAAACPALSEFGLYLQPDT